MYSYGDLIDDVKYLENRGITTGYIGKSLLGRAIPYIKVGCGEPVLMITAGIHARENVSCRVAVSQLFAALKNGVHGTVYFLPMLNPDGAEIVRKGASALAPGYRFGCEDFRLWKANARGVDLNVNFDAGFGQGVQNVLIPGAESYIGEYPFSEPETEALRDFTLSVKPDMTVSYHAKGRMIYWYFGQRGERKRRDLRLARAAAKATGFALVDGAAGSAGGYKDWCVQKLGIASLTVELVPDEYSHPLPDSVAESEIQAVKCLPDTLLGVLKELK